MPKLLAAILTSSLTLKYSSVMSIKIIFLAMQVRMQLLLVRYRLQALKFHRSQ